MCKVFLIMMIMLMQISHASDYYASPNGNGDGKTIQNPCQIKSFWNDAKPGDVLFLLDGKYTEETSMIKPLSGINGTTNSPITIKALNDGRVEIDGQGEYIPVNLMYENCYLILEGFNAYNSAGDVISIRNNSNYNIVRRVCAWDALNGNSSIFGTHHAEHNLIEDCAGWGVARKTFSNSQGGNYTTYRRCWGQWEYLTGFDQTAPRMTYTLFYNSYHVTMENCIGTWNAQGDDPAPPAPYGIFAADREDEDKNTYCAWLGCIAYVTVDQQLAVFDEGSGAGGMFHFVSWNASRHGNVLMKDCIAYVDSTHSNIKTFELRKGDELVAENLTSIGGAGNNIHGDWEVTKHLNSSNGAELVDNDGNILDPGHNGIDNGATILKRYKDRVLTDENLWPWPMNKRIIDAMTLSGRKPVDVTKTIFELAGGTTSIIRSGNGHSDTKNLRANRAYPVYGGKIVIVKNAGTLKNWFNKNFNVYTIRGQCVYSGLIFNKNGTLRIPAQLSLNQGTFIVTTVDNELQ